MRRALSLFAIVMAGTASAVPAQARAVITGHLNPQPKGPPQVAIHVSNLLDDPLWLEQWGNAFFVQVHWKVQLWQENKFLIFSGSLPAVEWDVCVRQVPGLDLFNYSELIRDTRRTTTFSTLDSLKAHLIEDVAPPVPGRLASGKWFYLVDARVSPSPEDPCDPRTPLTSGGFLQSLVQGVGPTRDLPTVRLPFRIP